MVAREAARPHCAPDRGPRPRRRGGMSDPNYCYPPDYIVLRNRLDIRDAPTLEAAERQFVAQRLLEAVPTGDFDLAHLKAIHGHLFQDVYAWAGEVRTVEIAKSESRFQPRRFIAAGMADVHRRIVAAEYFRGSEPDGFAERAGSGAGRRPTMFTRSARATAARSSSM